MFSIFLINWYFDWFCFLMPVRTWKHTVNLFLKNNWNILGNKMMSDKMCYLLMLVKESTVKLKPSGTLWLKSLDLIFFSLMPFVSFRLEGLMDLYSQGYERSYTVNSSILNAIEPHLKDFQQLLLDPPKVKMEWFEIEENKNPSFVLFHISVFNKSGRSFDPRLSKTIHLTQT